MNPLCAFCLVLLLLPAARAVTIFDEQLPEGATGLVTQMASYMDMASSALDDTGFLEATSAIGKLARFMGPVGMVVSMALTFVEVANEGPSEELMAIMKLHEQTDSILTEIKNINKVLPAALWHELVLDQMTANEALLETINTHATRYMENPTDYQLSVLRDSCGKFHALQMLNDIKATFDTDDELEKLYIALDYDYREVDSTMAYLEWILVTAGIQRSTCLLVDEILMGQTTEYIENEVKTQAAYWNEDIEKISVALDPVRKTKLVEFIKRDRAYETDVGRFMEENSVLSQMGYDEFAKQLATELGNKFGFYDEVKFTVAAYSSNVAGSYREGWNFGVTGYYGSYRQGTLRLEKYGKAVVVFWTYCEQPLIFSDSFGIRLWDWGNLKTHLFDIFPSTYAMMYFDMSSDWGLYYNNQSYISWAYAELTRGYYSKVWPSKKVFYVSEQGGLFLYVSLTDCSKEYIRTYSDYYYYSSDLKVYYMPI